MRTPRTDNAELCKRYTERQGEYQVDCEFSWVEPSFARELEEELRLHQQNQIDLMRVLHALLRDPFDRSARAKAETLLRQMDSPEELEKELER